MCPFGPCNHPLGAYSDLNFGGFGMGSDSGMGCRWRGGGETLNGGGVYHPALPPPPRLLLMETDAVLGRRISLEERRVL